jgi:hypothetical protein
MENLTKIQLKTLMTGLYILTLLLCWIFAGEKTDFKSWFIPCKEKIISILGIGICEGIILLTLVWNK